MNEAPPGIVVLNERALALARRLKPTLPGATIHGLAGRADGADAVHAETAPAIRDLFANGRAIVGVCAAGILVRALAPVLGDKKAEPPVVAVAADGSAVVPLLGGLTGGEDLARRVAAALGVAPASTAVMALESDAAAGGGARPGDGARGGVTVLGLGPGDPDWTTPQVARALAEASDLVGYETYLARVPPRAGQRRHASDNTQELDRARHAFAMARAGARVAVVSSGDPGIFAMAAAVMEAVDADPALAEGVDVRVLPGLSAMQAVAARFGAPLGHDFAAISLSDRLKPWEAIAARLEAAARADMAIALYNPASKTRRAQIAAARDLLLALRAADTPVLVGRDVGGPDEALRIETLATLDTDAVDMRTLLIVCASHSRVIRLGDGRSLVYTPRRYDARP